MKKTFIILVLFPLILKAQNFAQYNYTQLPTNSSLTPTQSLNYIKAIQSNADLRIKVAETVSGSVALAALYYNVVGSSNAYSNELLLNAEQFHTDDLNQAIFLLSYYSNGNKDYFYNNQLFRIKDQLTPSELKVLNAFHKIHSNKIFQADSMIKVLSSVLYSNEKEVSTLFNRKKIAYAISYLQANALKDIQAAKNTYNEFLNSPFNKSTTAFDFCNLAIYNFTIGLSYKKELELAARNAYSDLNLNKISLTDYFFIYNTILSACIKTNQPEYFTLFVHSTQAENPLKEIQYLYKLAYPKNAKEFNTFLAIYQLYHSESVFLQGFDLSDILFETDLQLLPENKTNLIAEKFEKPASMFLFSKSDYLVLLVKSLESILDANPNYWVDFFDPKCEHQYVCLEHKNTTLFLLYQQLANLNELTFYNSSELQTFAMRFLTK